MILGSSKDPARRITLESTIKGGSCQSCGLQLKPGEIRVKVSYPNVFVHYYSRSGTPSFFMHPFCYQICPVDFRRDGRDAWKETLRIKGFVLNPSTDICGYANYPDLHDCFQHSLQMYEKEQKLAAENLSEVQPNSELLQPVSTTDPSHVQVLHETEKPSLSEIPNLKSDLSRVGGQKAEAALPPSTTCTSVSFPKLAGTKRPRCDLLSAQIPVTWEADEEESQLLQAECYREQYPSWTNSDLHDLLKFVSPKPLEVVKSKCGGCGCHTVKPEKKWASPQEAAEILGISATILRSLANAREIPIWKRPSGHRVYDIPAIREYFAKKVIKAKVSTTAFSRELVSSADPVIPTSVAEIKGDAETSMTVESSPLSPNLF
jgi:hypothetical protein